MRTMFKEEVARLTAAFLCRLSGCCISMEDFAMM